METYDVVVIGGGPAGSACATALVRAGFAVAILDRETFPRTKLCAGWITPEVIKDLQFETSDYPHRFMTFDNIVVHLKGLAFKLAGPQHSIRRFEFDNFLLQRSGAEICYHNARELRKDNGHYVIDDRFRCKYLVGAGGTRCPVYRTFFREANPRAKQLQATTYEYEFPYDWQEPRCHLWFFDRRLPGYSWYVPKADGYVNCGIGAMAGKLKRRGGDIKAHWRHLTSVLTTNSFVDPGEYNPSGYSYYLRGNVDVVRMGTAFIIGDAVGLATRDLCEGIGPAVRSGQLAAEAISTGSEYSLAKIAAYSSKHYMVRGLLEYMLHK